MAFRHDLVPLLHLEDSALILVDQQPEPSKNHDIPLCKNEDSQ